MAVTWRSPPATCPKTVAATSLKLKGLQHWLNSSQWRLARTNLTSKFAFKGKWTGRQNGAKSKTWWPNLFKPSASPTPSTVPPSLNPARTRKTPYYNFSQNPNRLTARAKSMRCISASSPANPSASSKRPLTAVVGFKQSPKSNRPLIQKAPRFSQYTTPKCPKSRSDSLLKKRLRFHETSNPSKLQITAPLPRVRAK